MHDLQQHLLRWSIPAIESLTCSVQDEVPGHLDLCSHYNRAQVLISRAKKPSVASSSPFEGTPSIGKANLHLESSWEAESYSGTGQYYAVDLGPANTEAFANHTREAVLAEEVDDEEEDDQGIPV